MPSLRSPCLVLLSQGLLQSCSGDSLALDPNVRMITLYDNEEVSKLETEPVWEISASCLKRKSFCSVCCVEFLPKQLLFLGFSHTTVSMVYSELPEKRLCKNNHTWPVKLPLEMLHINIL